MKLIYHPCFVIHYSGEFDPSKQTKVKDELWHSINKWIYGNKEDSSVLYPTSEDLVWFCGEDKELLKRYTALKKAFEEDPNNKGKRFSITPSEDSSHSKQRAFSGGLLQLKFALVNNLDEAIQKYKTSNQQEGHITIFVVKASNGRHLLCEYDVKHPKLPRAIFDLDKVLLNENREKILFRKHRPENMDSWMRRRVEVYLKDQIDPKNPIDFILLEKENSLEHIAADSAIIFYVPSNYFQAPEEVQSKIVENFNEAGIYSADVYVIPHSEDIFSLVLRDFINPLNKVDVDIYVEEDIKTFLQGYNKQRGVA